MVDTRRAPGAAKSSTVQVNDGQLEQQQNQDYPYPTASGKGITIKHRYRLKDNSELVIPAQTKKHIPVTDEKSMTSLGRWRQQWTVGRLTHSNTLSWHRHEMNEPCPTTLRFARWGVLVGVIFATIYMAFAAYSVVLGHKDAGGRVVSAAAGLMLLLSGYTIYKIVMINAFRYQQQNTWDQIKPQQANNGANNATNPNLPPVPVAGGGRPQRSGIPVVPLGGSVNR